MQCTYFAIEKGVTCQEKLDYIFRLIANGTLGFSFFLVLWRMSHIYDFNSIW